MSEISITENAVLGDQELQDALKTINPQWGELCIRVCGEVWGLPLIEQKTKAFIAIALDVISCNTSGPGSPFEAHLDMALKQGATKAEIEELMLFLCSYAGFNKVASALGRLKEIEAKGETAFGTKI